MNCSKGTFCARVQLDAIILGNHLFCDEYVWTRTDQRRLGQLCAELDSSPVALVEISDQRPLQDKVSHSLTRALDLLREIDRQRTSNPISD